MNWPPPTKYDSPHRTTTLPWNWKYFDLPPKPQIPKFQTPPLTLAGQGGGGVWRGCTLCMLGKLMKKLSCWYTGKNNKSKSFPVLSLVWQYLLCLYLLDESARQSRFFTTSASRASINCIRLFPSKSVKYLGIKSDENLNWKQHIHDIPIKLNRGNALLHTIRNYVNKCILRYSKNHLLSIFDSHTHYANLIWGQNQRDCQQITFTTLKGFCP